MLIKHVNNSINQDKDTLSTISLNKTKSPLQVAKWSEVAQSCPTLCDPMDCSLSGSSVYGIFQARVLEWIAISFSRGSSRPRNWTQVSCIAGRRFTVWATREAQVAREGWISTWEEWPDLITILFLLSSPPNLPNHWLFGEFGCFYERSYGCPCLFF